MRSRTICWLCTALFLTIAACTPARQAPSAPRPITSVPATSPALVSSGAKVAIAPATPTIQPTASQTPAAPSPTPVEFPHNEKPFAAIPTIEVSAAPGDPRIPLVQQAVDHWNQVFQQIGTPFRLGAVASTIDLLPEADYQPWSDAGRAQIEKLPGDIFIVLSSDPKFISETHHFGDRRLIAIQARPGGQNSLAIDVNVIEHEIGHAIGLGHNNVAGSLMCGLPQTPAQCGTFTTWAALNGSFAPLTDSERAYLKAIYPPDWKPSN